MSNYSDVNAIPWSPSERAGGCSTSLLDIMPVGLHNTRIPLQEHRCCSYHYIPGVVDLRASMGEKKMQFLAVFLFTPEMP